MILIQEGLGVRPIYMRGEGKGESNSPYPSRRNPQPRLHRSHVSLLPRLLLSRAPLLLTAVPDYNSRSPAAAHAVLAHRRTTFPLRTCGLRGGVAATALLIGRLERDQLLPLYRRVSPLDLLQLFFCCAAHLEV